MFCGFFSFLALGSESGNDIMIILSNSYQLITPPNCSSSKQKYLGGEQLPHYQSYPELCLLKFASIVISVENEKFLC